MRAGGFKRSESNPKFFRTASKRKLNMNFHLDMQEVDPDMKEEEVDQDLKEVRVEQRVIEGVSHQEKRKVMLLS